mgnify:CR=1 FL=1
MIKFSSCILLFTISSSVVIFITFVSCNFIDVNIGGVVSIKLLAEISKSSTLDIGSSGGVALANSQSYVSILLS